MDVRGASVLAARIRAGVRIGQVIELSRDSPMHAPLKRGDLGIVTGFTAGGNIVVEWDGGSIEELDPATETYEAVRSRAARTA